MKYDDLKKTYSYWKIKKIFSDDYGLSLIPVISYKGTRYVPQKYSLVNDSDEIVLANVTLDALRSYLASENY